MATALCGPRAGMTSRLRRIVYRLVVTLCLVAVVALLKTHVYDQWLSRTPLVAFERISFQPPTEVRWLEFDHRTVVSSVPPVHVVATSGSRDDAKSSSQAIVTAEPEGRPRSLGSESPSHTQLATQDPQHVQSTTTQDRSSGESQSKPTTLLTHANVTLSPKLSSPTAAVSLGPPVSQPKGCKEKNCKEFLSRIEIMQMKQCESMVHRHPGVPLEEGKCNFMDGRGRLAVALSSMEGSGNTWIRGLLERVTGICTGFVACDYEMRSHGFIGENIRSGSVIVVKSHAMNPQWYGVKYRKPISYEGRWGSAIFVVRNPFDSLIAEWNRYATNMIIIKKRLPHNGSHINVIPKTLFNGTEWEKFFPAYLKNWRHKLLSWVINETDHPVHVVRYEDLKRDTLGVLKSLLDFMKIPYEEEAMAVRLKEDFDMFQRKHDGRFDPYPPEKKEFVRNMLLEMIELAEARKLNDQLQLHHYLSWPSEP